MLTPKITEITRLSAHRDPVLHDPRAPLVTQAGLTLASKTDRSTRNVVA
jgi:hypothetical protein